MEKSLFEQMGGTYTLVGDYYLPNFLPAEQEEKPIGVWGAVAFTVYQAKSQGTVS